MKKKKKKIQSSKKTKTLDRSTENNNVVSFPSEIIEDILSRLPVKSILRSTSVCKPWLSLITNPSFTKLHFSRATASLLFITAFDNITHKHYLFSGAHDGGPLTLFMTLDKAGHMIKGITHLNGLLCFTSYTQYGRQACVLNPSTRKIFKLPAPDSDTTNSTSYKLCYVRYLFGFDESRNEYKILRIRKKVEKSETFEFMIFSLSSHSWRKIDVGELPVGFHWDCLGSNRLDGGVCVNSVVHVIVKDLDMPYKILAFDFVTERFSFISIPRDEIDYVNVSITKIDGRLGVVFYDQENWEILIWLLRDYDDRVWVRETIKFPRFSWDTSVGMHFGSYPPSIDVNMDGEIVFFFGVASKKQMFVPVYNRKSKCFRRLQFDLEDRYMCSRAVQFNHIKCYVESIISLSL